MREMVITGRFTAPDRHLLEEETVRLVTVGVDIGSSTSHLVFSRLELERRDNRYVVTSREVLAQSHILLTPYRDETTIDGEVLGAFIEQAYAQAGLRRDEVDTGALILTGVALRRENARAIAELFAQEAGRFVAVSAGDNLEALMAAHGSGAAEGSLTRGQTIMNVDIGGGTTKIAVCVNGKPVSLAAMDVGARLVALDEHRRVTRLEEAGRTIGRAVGLDLALGRTLSEEDARRMARYMAERVLAMICLRVGAEEELLLRTPPPSAPYAIEAVTFSGGVSEFIHARETQGFGDFGALLAEEVRARVEAAGVPIIELPAGIRATVIGASQYTIQVSGSTIFINPADAVPVRNVPVIAPALSLAEDTLDADLIADSVTAALQRLDLADGHAPVAVAARWEGSATYGRIDAFCRGIRAGLAPVLAHGHPLVLLFDGDVGGLFGLHLKETLGIENAVISVDSVQLTEFDFVDIGALLPASGAVPVVIKSLVFPSRAANGAMPRLEARPN